MKNILVVVDMQKGFARYEQTQALVEKIEALLERKIFDVVIATKFLNGTNSIYEKLFNWKRLETHEEQAFSEKIQKNIDCVVEKYVYNCVNSNFIQLLCQLNDGCFPEKIFLVGADTDCCVLTIATSLFENNIRPIVLEKYCNSNGGPESHKAGLTCLKRLIGENQIYMHDPKTIEDLQKV